MGEAEGAVNRGRVPGKARQDGQGRLAPL